MELLLILLIIFFVLPWVLRQITPWLLRWFIRRQTRRFMGDAFGNASAGDSGAYRNNAPHQQGKPRRRGKKIDPSVGEYIEFTEIKGTTVTEGERPKVTAESQITDIEWEDLP